MSSVMGNEYAIDIVLHFYEFLTTHEMQFCYKLMCLHDTHWKHHVLDFIVWLSERWNEPQIHWSIVKKQT